MQENSWLDRAQNKKHYAIVINNFRVFVNN